MLELELLELPVPKRLKLINRQADQNKSDGDSAEDIYLNKDSYHIETINRHLLDFDFEKLCSVTLSNINVYCCLVCGKYFQGRSESSPAYNHSLTSSNHHIFLNLQTENVYVLPENYEITSPAILESIQDVKDLLNPKYNASDIKELANPIIGYNLEHKPYHVGYVGLNSLSNDYSNVVIQLLAHIPPIRDFYLSLSYQTPTEDLLKRKSELNYKFSLLIRKIWSKHLFKAHVSPYEFLQFVATSTHKKFALNTQSASPRQFLMWLLNQLNLQLKSSKVNILTKTLQGTIEINTIKVSTKEVNNTVKFINSKTSSQSSTKFWFLTLDLPTNPIFAKDSKIEEVFFEDLMMKYNGAKTIQAGNDLKTYKLLQPLPKYLLFQIDRDLEDVNFKRGNPTVVKFPNELDFAPYVKDSTGPLIYKPVGIIKHSSIAGSSIDHKDDKSEWSISLRRNGFDWVTLTNLEVKNSEVELLFLDQSYIFLWATE